MNDSRIAEEIRWLMSKKWYTKEDEELLEDLYEIRDAQQRADKKERGQ